MKIFGFNISFKKDEAVVIKTVAPSTIPVSKIPEIKVSTLSYFQQFAYGRGNFQASEYNLAEIGKIEDVESYVRQSFKKKEGLMFKEGISFNGPNKDILRYYKTRMAQIARATNIPTSSLLKRISASLIRVSNAFLVKVRDIEASGGQIRKTARGKVLKPIAGYFLAAPETMRADVDYKTGRVVKWRQILPSGYYRDYDPEDVIHFFIDRREGFLFGVPTIIPAIDDIRALRQIEENIELLLYQHLFPLFHYKVGTETAPAGYTETGEKEIDLVQEQIRMMPSEGAIVTPERHEIKAVGAEGRAIHAEGYVEHFKKRVFAGLGISAVDIGEGDTTNKSTAFTLSRALVDSVKAIQDELECQWDQEVVTEILLESTFGDDVLEEDAMVHLKFNEIDIATKMEQEEHHVSLFKSNAITWDELRASVGREPIPVPEDPGDQDPSKYPEWFKTYWKLFEEPLNIIRAVDEPASIMSSSAVASPSLSVTSEQQKTAVAKQKETKQLNPGIARAPRVPVALQKDHYLSQSFSSLQSELSEKLLSNLESRNTIDEDYLLSFSRTWASHTSEHFCGLLQSELTRGYISETKSNNLDIKLLNSARSEIKKRIDYRLDKLVKDIYSLLKTKIDSQSLDGKLLDAKRILNLTFDTLRYRADFIFDVETRKSYNWGRVIGMKVAGKKNYMIVAHPDSCENCRTIDGKIISVEMADMDDVPPFHSKSRTDLVEVKE